MTKSVLALSQVTKTYAQPGGRLVVLDKTDLTIKRGESLALVGPSGSGKSTLLQIAGLLDTPDSGEVKLGNIVASSATEAERCDLRLRYLGFIYQFHYLLSEFSAVENVMLPRLLAGGSKQEARQQAMDLLKFMRLADKAHSRPAELSGGEQQRVAVARSLINRPQLLLADEPTGNLDQENAILVFDLFIRLVEEIGLTLLLVTHNLELAKRLQRQVIVDHGKLVER